MKRRQFLQTSVMAASAAMITPSFTVVEKKAVGLQLYTLRDILKTDVKGIMKQVSDFGYKKIETFGYNDGMLFGMKSKEFSELVSGLGMKLTSGHYGTGQTKPESIGTLVNGWEKAVSDAKEAGQDYMVIAYLQADERKTLDDYKKVCGMMNKGAEVCKKYGIQFSYHNHAFEFDKLDNQVPFDVMLQELDPKLVTMEMDIYWTVAAKQDPLAYFSKFPGRFDQWHIKDMDKVDSKKNSVVGNGSIDFKAYFAKAKEAGLKNFYIEHDTFPTGVTSIDAARDDIKNLNKII